MKSTYALVYTGGDWYDSYEYTGLYTTNKKQLEDLATKLNRDFGSRGKHFCVTEIPIADSLSDVHIQEFRRYHGLEE